MKFWGLATVCFWGRHFGWALRVKKLLNARFQQLRLKSFPVEIKGGELEKGLMIYFNICLCHNKYFHGCFLCYFAIVIINIIVFFKHGWKSRSISRDIFCWRNFFKLKEFIFGSFSSLFKAFFTFKVKF